MELHEPITTPCELCGKNISTPVGHGRYRGLRAHYRTVHRIEWAGIDSTSGKKSTDPVASAQRLLSVVFEGKQLGITLSPTPGESNIVVTAIKSGSPAFDYREEVKGGRLVRVMLLRGDWDEDEDGKSEDFLVDSSISLREVMRRIDRHRPIKLTFDVSGDFREVVARPVALRKKKKRQLHPFLQAAVDGNREILMDMVHKDGEGKLKAIRDAYGSTALHFAAGSGHLSCVEALVSTIFSGEIDVQTTVTGGKGSKTGGRTPCHYACRNGHFEVLRTLIDQYKANPHVISADGVTLFMAACKGGDMEILRYLVNDCAVKKDYVNVYGCNACHTMALNSSLEVFSTISEEFELDLNHKNVAGHTPVFKAAFRGRRDVVEWLIKRLGKVCLQGLDEEGFGVGGVARVGGFGELADWLELQL